MADLPKMDTPDMSKLTDGTHYNVLGVSPNATKEDIHKAYVDKARRFHPDKNPNPNADEWMKRINQAKEVLSDNIQRAKYDDDMHDETNDQGQFESAGALLPGRQLSVILMELFATWLKKWKSIKPGQFHYSLKELLRVFLDNQFKQWKKQLKHQQPKATKPKRSVSLYSQCLESTGKLSRDFSILATVEVRKVVCDVLECARATPSKQYPSVVQPGTLLPVLDLSKTNLSQQFTLLKLFFAEFDSSLNHRAMMAALAKFVPQVTVQPMQKPERNSCVMCRQKLPRKPPSPCIVLPRLGQMKPQKVCTSCCELTYQQDMNAWIEAGLGLFRSDGLANIRPALGCFILAVCSCQHSTEPIMKLARKFLDLGIPELGLSLLSDLLKNHKEPNVTMKAHLLASTLLKSIAELVSNGDLFGRWEFLCTAKEACVLAHSAACSTDNLIEAPELVSRKSDLDTALYSQLEKMEDSNKSFMKKMLDALEMAWSKRDWEQILSIIKEKSCDSDHNLAKLTNSQHFREEAFDKFLASKEGFLAKLLPDDRFPLLFLRGVLSIQKGQISSGLKDLEVAAWNSHHARWLHKEIVAVMLTLLPSYTESILPVNALQITCNSLARGADISSSCTLFPTIDELLKPPKILWEEIVVPNLGMKSTRRFEQSVSRQVDEGRLTVHEAALAYTDYCLACHHPAEAAVCFLTASVWFLRELREKAKASHKQQSELYALKTTVRWLLEQAAIIAHLSLHPGMRVYVSSIGLVIMLDAVKVAGKLATPEDSKLVAHLLEMFTYNCRFCPFWHAPIVTVSEAVLLHIFSGRLHSKFTLGLTDTSVLDLPVSKSELRYQIYENSIRHLHSVEDPAEACRIAMFELLEEKGWSFQNVIDLMTSPLSPRTPDGWLIRQPILGTKMEFTKFAGFVFDPDSGTIQIIVVPAQYPNRPGLFSRSDINTVLQLGKDDLLPIFFSLDPPHEHQGFHPFQEVRYLPQQLQGTDLLHTLFETDYLLKSFSVGSEVSSVPPFHQRPCSDGLTADLPPKLHQVLKPISERGDRSSHTNRFWIQADELTYSTSQTDSGIVFLLSDPVMSVRSRPQLPSKDGLKDTDNEHDPNSPEGRFAADLTSHYQEIGKHFPMFARLQELVKLQFFGLALNGITEDVEEHARGSDIEVTDEMLQTIQTDQRKSQMESINTMLNSLYDQAKLHYNSTTASIIESQVVDALMEATSYNLQRWTLSGYVSTWLSSYYSSSTADQLKLASYMCSSFPLITKQDIKKVLLEKRRQHCCSFLSKVESIRSAAKRATNKHANNCKWVPAAMNRQEDEDSSSLCYGGVLIAPKINKGNVPLNRNANRVNLTPSAASQAGSSSGGRGGSGSRGGGGGSQGGGGDKGGRPTVKINDERNRWDHIFTDKFGHVNPKESHSQERFKKLFVHVANEGVNRTDGRAKKAQEHGDFAFKIDYRRCPVHVLVSKDGYIKSAYKAIGNND